MTADYVNLWFNTDGMQPFDVGKIVVNEIDINLMSLTDAKIYGPKRDGRLICRLKDDGLTKTDREWR